MKLSEKIRKGIKTPYQEIARRHGTTADYVRAEPVEAPIYNDCILKAFDKLRLTRTNSPLYKEGCLTEAGCSTHKHKKSIPKDFSPPKWIFISYFIGCLVVKLR